MAHDIDTSNKRNNIAYAGAVPWHGLGQNLSPTDSINTWRVEAGLDWKVERTPVSYKTPEGRKHFDNRDVLFRDDTVAPLGIVGVNYKVVQPKEVLDLYEKLTTGYGATMEVAGSLRGGEVIWCLARTDHVVHLSDDQINGYLLLTTSYTGQSSTIARFTSVRVVCNNTLEVSLTEGGNQIKIPHSRTFKSEEVEGRLGLLGESWERFEDRVTTLASTPIELKEAQQWLLNVFGDPEKALEEQPNAQQMKRVMQLYQGGGIGSQMESTKGTAWGLVNAVTELVDHNKRARSADSKLMSAWMGDGAALKRRAYSEALKLAA